MNKYITIIDHLAGSEKPFTYLANKGETKSEIVARAAMQFHRFNSVFNVKVAKRVAKNKYLPIYAIYADGGIDDYTKNNWNGWGKSYHTVTPDKLEA